MNICVYGASSPRIDRIYFDSAERLGEIIASRGHTLIFGAGDNGLMGAVARGASRGKGKIHGIIPAFFKDEHIEAIYTGCDELTFTENMRERKQLMEDFSDAFIIAPGGIGTYEEFFEILTLKQLGRHKKPIVIYNVNGYYDELAATLENAAKKGFVTQKCLALYTCTDDAERAVSYAEECGDCDFSVKDLKEG